MNLQKNLPNELVNHEFQPFEKAKAVVNEVTDKLGATVMHRFFVDHVLSPIEKRS